jgi:hypothetical protein
LKVFISKDDGKDKAKKNHPEEKKGKGKIIEEIPLDNAERKGHSQGEKVGSSPCHVSPNIAI